METALIIIGILLLLIILVWVGLQIKPGPFPAFPQSSVQPETVPLPSGLPAPVERFYRKLYGERIPVVTSAVMTGRARLRPVGKLFLQGRYRFTHDVGHGYRHYIEATLFGLPVMKVNERYLDGKSLIELPMGTDEGPKLNQAANLGMWAELLLLPCTYLTDPRVHWEALDDQSALLVVPFEDSEERFVVRFDPRTSLPRYMEVMRYQNEKSPVKSLWITATVKEAWSNGFPVQQTGSATWFQDGSPWAFFTMEDLRYNVDVSEYIRAKGV